MNRTCEQNLLLSKREVTKHLGKKRATVLYPFEEVRPPREFRGKLEFDDESCMECGLCELDCPAFAI